MGEIGYRKSGSKTYVSIGGVEVGWATKIGREWLFFAPVSDSLQGERMSAANTRWEAVYYGLSRLKSFYLGRVVGADGEPVWVSEEALKSVMDGLLMEHYGAA